MKQTPVSPSTVAGSTTPLPRLACREESRCRNDPNHESVMTIVLRRGPEANVPSLLHPSPPWEAGTARLLLLLLLLMLLAPPPRSSSSLLPPSLLLLFI